MIRPTLALALLLAATAAQAEEKVAHAIRPAMSGYDLAPVAVPVVVGGQVRNYIFVTVRLLPTATADNSAMRAKEPFFRDAFVRAGHATPFTRADDYNSIDEAKASAAMMAAAPGIVGKGQVRAVTISKQQPKNLLRAPARPKTVPAA